MLGLRIFYRCVCDIYNAACYAATYFPQTVFLYDKQNKIACEYGKTIRSFIPHVLVSGPMIQTMMSKLLSRFWYHVRFTRLSSQYRDGERLDLDIYPGKQNLGATVFFICHGLGGSSESGYCHQLAHFCKERGSVAVVYNRRGHISKNRSESKPFPLHCDYDDMGDAVKFCKSLFPNSRIVGVGVSLGANLLLKYVQEHETHPFTCVISVCNGLDALQGAKLLVKADPLVDEIAAGYMKEIMAFNVTNDALEKKLKLVKSFLDADKTIMEHYYGPNFDQEAYLQSISSVHNVDKIHVPVLMIAARDDPFIKSLMSLYQDLHNKNPSVCCIVTDYGGHVGWVDNIRGSWLYERCIDFANVVEKNIV